ncbi:MAG: DUF2318 domain-containing protein [Desulfuromonadales bacterium]|nr:DUF2318 domain-containing protein [Desulfuromonadales bacterium]NIR33524.1 DUF2318 domain-containing protein [Desulfuromonadales bacterium]NIS39698.1 DUF2318 domain-containing protein [Desulfuromonadales bacterium]
MIVFLVHTVDAFLPLALCLAGLGALMQFRSGRRPSASLFWAVAAGLVAGAVIYSAAAASEQFTAVRTVLRATLLAAALPALAAALFLPLRTAWARKTATTLATVFLAALAGQGLFALRDSIYYEGLSTISVLNTELILNLGGIFAGAVLAAALCILLWQLAMLLRREAVAALLAVATTVLGLLWGAEALLGLMRMQLIELTSARLSFVAVVTDYAGQRSYLLLGLALLLAVLFLRRALAAYRVTAPTEQRAKRRKERSLRLAAKRRFKLAGVLVMFLVGSFLYHDLYASRPPRISEPTTVSAGEDGLLRFKTADFADGALHRFAYVMQDGKVVRFFLMNKFRDQVKIGVALDACLLCGDMGYIKNEDNLICLACDVSIFVPSLGKAGGCNPIPLAHRFEGDEIIIAAADLEAGARYFNEVRDIEVQDPVTGETVINTEAPYEYEYRGRTYFFASEKSWRTFREMPENYIEADAGDAPGANGGKHEDHSGHSGHGGHAGHGEG